MAYDPTLALLLGCWFALVALAAWEFGAALDKSKPDRKQEWLDRLKEFKDDDSSGGGEAP